MQDRLYFLLLSQASEPGPVSRRNLHAQLATPHQLLPLSAVEREGVRQEEEGKALSTGSTTRSDEVMHADLPAGTVTLLFTDIEGSTCLLQQMGDKYAHLLADCRRLLRAAFQQWKGYEVDSQGDAFFVAFARASDAVSAAVTIQRALASHGWPEGVTVRVRMGLHTGEPQVSSEGYVGLDVHYAARIMKAGHGGQVLLSQTTRDLLEYDPPEGVSLRNLGEHRLKDVERPGHLFQVDIAGLPAAFPPLQTLDARLNNLPAQSMPLIDREKEMERICQLLRCADVRLLTLTGTGGVGKTRLGLETAARLFDEFAEGVCLVPLATISDPDLVVPTIAQALGVREVGGWPLMERLKAYLHHRQLLLFLDNFEQVLMAAPLLSELLQGCPGLKLLVTSRAVLHVYGEHEFHVLPFPVPDLSHLPEGEALAQYAAVALFLQHAQAVKPGFQMTPANAHAIASICARLDGLPLAIELAAARVKLFSPQALLARLTHRLEVLTSGAQDIPARQQTLRNMLGWSYNLLDAREQRLFRRLSVFAGGCALEAVEAIYTTLGDLAAPVLDRVASLIDKSLLQKVEQEDEELRLLMLETVREYGLECLSASGEMEATRQAHALYYLALAEEAETKLEGPQQTVWLEREHDNLRAAKQWLLRQADD